jgi:uncharacterized membrane protein YdjX (TVP38/TMEM64 family)
MTNEPRTPSFGFRLAGRILILAALIAGIVVIWRNWADLDPVAIKNAIERYPFAPLIFLAIHILTSLLFIPRTLMAVVAGLLFGLWMGIVWAAAGSVIGAVAGFLLARYVNAGLIDLESWKNLGPLLLRAERGGWRTVAMLRLIPIMPHSIVNYALGLTRLPVGGYALGSLLGQLPMTVAYVDLGTAGGSMLVGNASWIEPTVVGLGTLTLSILLPRLFDRHKET